MPTARLLRVVERLYERQAIERGKRGATIGSAAAETEFIIGAVTNSKERNEAELARLDGIIEELIDAAALLDERRAERQEGDSRRYGMTPGMENALRFRIKDLRRAEDEDFKRRLASKLVSLESGNRGGRAEDESIEDFVRRTMSQSSAGTAMAGEEVGGGANGEFNATRFMMNMMQVPLWVPPQVLPFIVACPDELSADDAKKIKSEVLAGSRFYCQGWDSFRLAAIYRGNFVTKRASNTLSALSGAVSKDVKATLATGETAQTGEIPSNNDSVPGAPVQLSEEVFADVQFRLERAGMVDRVQLFLMNDPENEGPDGPLPILLVLPKSVAPQKSVGNGAKVLAALSVFSTAITTFAYAVSAYALNPNFFSAVVNDSDAAALLSCLPVFFGVLALQIVHEAAHAAVAGANSVKIGLPVPLPSLQIGTFGCITPLRSFPGSRKELLDIALSGPAACLLVSIMCMTAGIVLTVGAPADVLTDMPVVPAALMKSSFLVGSMVSALAPKVMAIPLSQPIAVHPLFMAGLTGLISSALNLLPVGRLDGGRAWSAVFGRRSAVLVSFLFLIVLAAMAITGISQIYPFWGLLIVLFQRNGDIPTRDEVTSVDGMRRGAYGALLAVALMILAPFPGGLGVL